MSIRGVTEMRKLLALATALTLVLLLSVRPAMAQYHPVVVDRTAFTFTYTPTGATSVTTFAVSYAFGPTWDLLASSTSGAAATVNAFRVGGRYHLRPPSPDTDVYLTAQYASPTTGASYILLGTGFTHTLVPGLKAFVAANYSTQTATQFIYFNAGWQYELSRQLSLVAGWDESTGQGYVGLSYLFALR